jgi:hypothetical protein
MAIRVAFEGLKMGTCFFFFFFDGDFSACWRNAGFVDLILRIRVRILIIKIRCGHGGSNGVIFIAYIWVEKVPKLNLTYIPPNLPLFSLINPYNSYKTTQIPIKITKIPIKNQKFPFKTSNFL